MQMLSPLLVRIVVLCVSLAITSCKVLYKPNAVHVPLFTKKETLQAKAAFGNSIDVSAAYSLTDKIAVMALGSFAPRKTSTGSTNVEVHAHTYGEIAGGHYWHDGVWRAEAYAGAGYGSAEAQWNVWSYQYQSQAEYTRLFAQINMGVEGDIVGAGVVLRPTYINFTNFRETENGQPHTSEGRSDIFLLEPTAFIRAGMKDVKFELQATMLFPWLYYRDKRRFDIEPFNASVGIQLYF